LAGGRGTASSDRERLACPEWRAGLLLGGVCGVQVDHASATARIADPALADAVRDAFSGERGELRRLARMGAPTIVRRAS
jgi:hypothetical protein